MPDTLTETQALELKLIVRDTIMAPALDSLFLSPRLQADRVYPFDPDNFVNSPTRDRSHRLRAGRFNSSGRSVPVFGASTQPTGAGDTLLVGNMEKASTAGNWTGE